MSCAALVLTVYLCEGLLRAWFILLTPLARFYPLGLEIAGSSLTFHHREFDITSTYNLSGFREFEIEPLKQPGHIRLLFLGDSFVEGYGVQATERFSTKLIDELNSRKRPRYEGINVGQIGTDPDAYFYNLTDFGIALRPDLVVMTIWMGNDFIDARRLQPPSSPVIRDTPFDDFLREGPEATAAIRLRYLRALAAHAFGAHRRLYRPLGNRRVSITQLVFHAPLTRQWLLDYLAKSSIEPEGVDRILETVDPQMLRDFFDGTQIPSILVERILHTLGSEDTAGQLYNSDDFARVLDWVLLAQEVCAARNIQFVVLLLPHISEVEPESFTEFLTAMGYPEPPPRVAQIPGMHEQFSRELKEKHVQVVDPTTALRQSPHRTYYKLDQHLTAAGHEVVGHALYNRVQRIKLPN